MGVIVVETELGPVSVIGDRMIEEVRLGIRLPESPNDFLLSVKDALSCYFNRNKIAFPFPLHISGTQLEKKVYEIVRNIPYGETRTYKEIAEKIGNPYLARFVGNTMRKNRIPIFIPCHRVLRKDGIGGYTGGIGWKKYLLTLEGVEV